MSVKTILTSSSLALALTVWLPHTTSAQQQQTTTPKKPATTSTTTTTTQPPATTSTTTGAHLLVSGVSAQAASASVLKYELVRPNDRATTLQARRLGQVYSGPGSQPATLGGD